MAEPISPTFAALNSQELLGALLDTNDVEGSVFGTGGTEVTESVMDVNLAPRVDGNRPSDLMEMVDNGDEVPAGSNFAIAPSRQRRQRFSYAKRHILGDHRLFIRNDYELEWRIHTSTSWNVHTIVDELRNVEPRRH